MTSNNFQSRFPLWTTLIYCSAMIFLSFQSLVHSPSAYSTTIHFSITISELTRSFFSVSALMAIVIFVSTWLSYQILFKKREGNPASSPRMFLYLLLIRYLLPMAILNQQLVNKTPADVQNTSISIITFNIFGLMMVADYLIYWSGLATNRIIIINIFHGQMIVRIGELFWLQTTLVVLLTIILLFRYYFFWQCLIEYTPIYTPFETISRFRS